MNDGLLGALWQTVWTWWRWRNVRCPHCASGGRKATLRSTGTARGYVLRCWQCGGEYGEYADGFRRVWPVEDESRRRHRGAASRTAQMGPHVCGHLEPDTACRTFEVGMNGRCVYCNLEERCHPGPGATCEIGYGG